jgi:hypothetical protein
LQCTSKNNNYDLSAGVQSCEHYLTVLPYKTDNVEKTKDLPFRKNEFLSQLKALHIGEWKSHYDRLALDGTQWHLGIYFSNFHEDIEIYGSNAYPYNFNKLCELMEISRFFWSR